MGIVFFFWREVLPLKFEIMRDGRPNLAGGKSRKLGVPVRPTVRPGCLAWLPSHHISQGQSVPSRTLN